MFPLRTFVKTFTVTSSSIKTATALDLITTSQIYGKLYVRDIILKTDSTGLAGGTNFQIKTTNAAGSATILATAISGLGANATINMDTASVTKQRTILESGSKLQLQNTVADGSGAGTVEITVILSQIDPTSQIA